jgi:sulfur-oxidizing protein SoxY
MMALGATVAAAMPFRAFANATEDSVAAFTGGAEMGENGNTVPVEVSAPGAVAILLLATGNPTPDAAIFNFGPLAASQMASTRIRLAKTQNVMAIAKMADGSFVQATQEVKVTIGGCGG